MKIKSLHIEDYKVFKDFDIDFLDEKGEALSIVVLAGVNGSGKTTLLEYIHETFEYDFIQLEGKILLDTSSFKDTSLPNPFEIEGHNSRTLLSKYAPEIALNQASLFFDKIIYLSTDTTIKNIKDLMPEYLKRMVWDEDIKASEAFERVRTSANNVFENMNLNIEFDSRDGEGNLYFRNKNSEEKFLIDALSTGEKTLMSKVLYLYLEEITDKVILIDEPELSLHPSWQNKVLKIYENFAKMSGCQIIIATHSPHIIGSAKNEYLRILKKNNEGKVEVVKDLKAEGRDINSILFDVMGEVAYRPREFDDKIDRLHIAIDDKKFDEANQRLEELKLSYGENDAVVMEAQMLIDMFSQED